MDTISTNIVQKTQFDILNIMLYAIVAILSTFVILNMVYGRQTLIAVELVLISISVLSIVKLKKILASGYSHKFTIVYSCFIVGLWLFIMMFNEVSILSFLWIFAVPVVLYIINGVHYGFILTLIFTLMSLPIFFFKTKDIEQLTIFAWANLLTVLAVIWGISHFYESKNISIKRDLEYQSTIDPLTNLKDRTRLYEAFRDCQNELACLVVLDIESLQSINEEHGHLAGDVVLMTIAKIIMENKSELAQVFRVGGDEFAILVPGASCEDCLGMTQQIYHKVNTNSLVIKRKRITINISMALACICSDGNNLDNLMIKAEKLLSKAKKLATDRILAC